MKHCAPLLAFLVVFSLSACSDEGGGSDASSSEDDTVLTSQSSTRELLQGLDSGDSQTRRFCAANISRRVEHGGERPPTDRLIERMRDQDEDPGTRWHCGYSVYVITGDKDLVRQPMLEMLAHSPGSAKLLSMELGVTLEEAMPYIEQLRENMENGDAFADDLIAHWGDF